MTQLNNIIFLRKPIHQPKLITGECSMLSRIKKCSTLKQLECFYASMVKTSANQDCFWTNQFVSACTGFRRMDYAILAFTQMKEPNVFVYNALIRGLVHCNYPVQALQYYVRMLRVGVGPTSFTFSSIFKGCGFLSAPELGKSIHGHIWKHGCESHAHVQTALLDFYANVGKFVESRRVFDEMPDRDGFAITTMISAHIRAGNLNLARALFDELPERTTASWNTLIDGFARVGDIKSAESLFNQIPSKDLISWTTMISCYSQNKQFGQAVAAFNDMRANNVKPDSVTIATVTSACAHLGQLDIGKAIHLYLMENGFDLDVYIGSALIDMYAKCGSLNASLLVFFKLREKNLFCWNSIIDGLSVHGYSEEGLKMFKRMEKDGFGPNGVTFLSVLSACTHAGLVEEGRQMFLSMATHYSINPEVEHYGCFVDLLSKAGLLEEALNLIRSMKSKTNSVVWGALLSGCKLHRNLEIAQVAVKELMVLEPNNSGYYTLLVGMYAEVGRWDEVAKIRQRMRGSGVEKNFPGSSWIEMGNKMHQFAAADKSHLASEDIYTFLEELDGQLKLAGTCYINELCFML